MLLGMNELKGYTILAQDGRIGTARDLLFDDRSWAVRYLVVDTGTWLPGRQVILAPPSLRTPEPEQREFPVALTRRQIEEGPPLDADAPVSRQHEAAMLQHYGWPAHWSGSTMPESSLYGVMPAAPVPDPVLADEAATRGDPNLRSAREVIGYYLEEQDGTLGSLYDLVIDARAWVVRYLVADTGSWLPGKKVLLPPAVVRGFDWSGGKLRLAATRQQVKDSPRFDSNTHLDRAQEEHIHQSFGVRPYW